MIARQTRVERKGGSIRNIKAVLMICMMAIVFARSPLNDHYAFSQEESVSPDSTCVPGPMDFKTCVKLALEQSPFFTEDAINIEVMRLNESDMRWSFIPSVNMGFGRSLGLKRRVAGGKVEEVTDIRRNFVISEYDPFQVYYSLKASERGTEIVALSHQMTIDNGIYDMAQKFLELETLGQIAECQEKILVQYSKKLTFFQERQKSGTATPIEVQLVEQELAVARAEGEYISARQSAIMEGLYQFLGLGPSQRLDLNLQEIRRQILGNLDPESFELKQARDHSFELKIRGLKERLQSYNISGAYAKFLPKFTFGIHRTSELDNVMPNEYYYSVYARMNLWNAFKDVHDVSRQKMILKQYESKTRLAEVKLNTEWKDAKRSLSEAEADMKLARLNEEMLILKEQENEISYGSNRKSLSSLLERRIASLNAHRTSLRKTHDYDQNVLKIRHLSGDLFNSFVNIAPWKE